jgi:putative flippase GtrA
MLWNLLGILVAFIPTNSFTYQTNRRWVFVAGKHSQKREFLLFTSGAAVTFVVCQLLAGFLINYTFIADYFILLIVIFASTLSNYIFRKCVVFNTAG